MHHCVNALHRPPEPVLVAHIPDEVAELGVVGRWKALGHLVLLELVSGVDDHPGDPWVFVQDDFNELVPAGAGAAGDEDVLAGHATLLTHYFFRSQPNSSAIPSYPPGSSQTCWSNAASIHPPLPDGTCLRGFVVPKHRDPHAASVCAPPPGAAQMRSLLPRSRSHYPWCPTLQTTPYRHQQGGLARSPSCGSDSTILQRLSGHARHK